MMWQVSQLPQQTDEVVASCLYRMRKDALRSRLEADRSQLIAYGDKYQKMLDLDTTHEIAADDFSLTSLTGDDMSLLYNQRLVGSRGKARKAYELIQASGRLGRCVYCGVTVPDSLDHFVPQKKVPALSIEPRNLIPACTRCNRLRGEEFSSIRAQQFLHPRASHGPTGRWLYSALVVGSPGAAVYSCRPDATLAGELSTRITRQFRKLRLKRLFESLAPGDIADQSAILTRTMTRSKPSAVRDYLMESAAGLLGSDPNHRLGVLLEAMGADYAFYSGGFKSI